MKNATSGTWEDMTGNVIDPELSAISIDPKSDFPIYLGGRNGLYRLDGIGGYWQQVFSCRGQEKKVADICVFGRSILIATKNGCYSSPDAGQNWTRIFKGLGAESDCTSLACSRRTGDKYILLGTAQGIFLSNDEGKAWKHAPGILGRAYVKSVTLSEDKAAYVIADNAVYKVTDNIGRYEKVFGSGFRGEGEEENDNEVSPEKDDPQFLLNKIICHRGVIYLSTNKGLFTSGDSGLSWLRFNDSGIVSRDAEYTLPAGDGNVRLFMATRDGIYDYDSTMEIWENAYEGISSVPVRALALTLKGVLWAACEKRVYCTKINGTQKDTSQLSADSGILLRFNNEPTVNEVMDAAIEYAEVYPDKIKKWREGAKYKALFPRVTLGFDSGWSDTYEIYTASSTSYWVNGPMDRSEGWDVNLSWDLADLVWNDAQTSIDVRSKLMVQLRDDIVDEVTRAYFERRRLQIEMVLDPPVGLEKRLKKILRIQELTASLDGLTGGYVSRRIQETISPEEVQHANQDL